jgi:hypothetical protein
MRQADIKIGGSYLFQRTEILHRKDLIGTVVKIIRSKIRGKGRVNYGSGQIHINGGWRVFITETGRKVSACELTEINL